MIIIEDTKQKKQGEMIERKSKMKTTNLKRLILKGIPASPGIATGKVRVLKNSKKIRLLLQGEVLVSSHTNPDFLPAMIKASAIVTDRGGITSHAAIVARELGIPAVVGTRYATKLLKNGFFITVNGTGGEIYEGKSPALTAGRQISNAKSQISKAGRRIKTVTKIYVNLAQPQLAKKIAKKNVDGVGLLRAEFIMAKIGVHPKRLILDGKKDIFVKKLSKDLKTICREFYPRIVVYRASDLKTNEYRELAGGKDFEPYEENPMLGFRGALRYIFDKQVFGLELESIRLVRKSFDNLHLMIPYVRTVKELVVVKQLISKARLRQASNFKLWMMVEVPSNVILLEKFIKVGIDGVSIGSNDLTQLILGVDRDNETLSKVFNEQDEALLFAFKHVIETAKKYKITSSICGQAPSIYPSLLRSLISWGITSVSVSPDAVEGVRKTVAECERKKIWRQ